MAIFSSLAPLAFTESKIGTIILRISIGHDGFWNKSAKDEFPNLNALRNDNPERDKIY